MAFKIEKGIPVGSNRTNYKDEIIGTLTLLNPGESFLIKLKESGLKNMITLYQMVKNIKNDFVASLAGREKDFKVSAVSKECGVRVWRIN